MFDRNSALIIQLLQKVQILTNELDGQKYSPNILLFQFFFAVNFLIETLTADIKAFFYLTEYLTFLTFL